MKKYFLLALLALGLMTSCQKENYLAEAVNDEPGFTVRAAVEELSETRTAMTPSSNSFFLTRWSENDAISVLKQGKHYRFVLTEMNENGTIADFDSDLSNITAGADGTDIPSSVLIGVYPFSTNVKASQDGDDFVINTSIPANQTYAEGSFGVNASPMVAVSVDKMPEFSFKNVGSVLRVNLKGNAVITKASLESKSHKIAGDAVVTAVAADKYIPVVNVENGISSIVLDCGEGVQINSENATSFHFVLAPGTYEANDLVLTFYNNKGEYYTTVIGGANTFVRSKGLSFNKTFAVSGTEVIDRWIKAEVKAYMDADRIIPSVTSLLDVPSWIVALKENPNALSLIEEATGYIVLQDFKSAYDVLGGIPGFKKDMHRFEASGKFMKKIDYLGQDYIDSYVEKITAINSVDDLYTFIEDFDASYSAYGFKAQVNEWYTKIDSYINQYVSETAKPFLKYAIKTLSKVTFVDILDYAVNGNNSLSKIAKSLLDKMFEQTALMDFMKSSLTTIVEGIEELARKTIDESNAELQNTAINIAKIDALKNARIAASANVWKEFDTVNENNYNGLLGGLVGKFSSLLNSKECAILFTEVKMLDVYDALLGLEKVLMDIVYYDDDCFVMWEKDWDEYAENVDWWVVSFNE